VKSLGHRMCEERWKRNFTLDQISQAINLSKGLLSQIERDIARPSVSTIKKISQQLGIRVVRFFTDVGSNQNDLGKPPSPQKIVNKRLAFINEVKVVDVKRRNKIIPRRQMFHMT